MALDTFGWPAVRIFHLSHLDKEREACILALGRAAIALGRKVLTDNPRPNIPMIAQYEVKKPPPQPACKPSDANSYRKDEGEA